MYTVECFGYRFHLEADLGVRIEKFCEPVGVAYWAGELKLPAGLKVFRKALEHANKEFSEFLNRTENTVEE